MQPDRRRPSAKAICARGLPCAIGRGSARRALDDRGRQRRSSPAVCDTIARGGHIRVGLEDAPLATTATNLELVEEAVRIVRGLGAEPATPAEMRQALAATSAQSPAS
ncbi:3-keto-5-aminohexanoate cleavage protein [Bradyrhizobium paxllaeri]|uniref:3-keto-5-aminohexanoate cleavage protein n=1 Tax=Bradyrhizobium paxllaeri TaxID=190148 RepID=UPI001FE30AD9|nr:3-keto-5-aminohexanoate cleavage protein [Bradyrhizobium paxllaeri]